MKTKEIKKLLHHREPYLLIDEVISLDKMTIYTQKKLTGKEYFFEGHFPGAPVLPGAIMQEITTQSAGILITKFYSPVEDYDSEATKGHALGVLKKVSYAKYKGFAKPNDLLDIQVTLIEKLDNLFEFKATILNDGKVIMKNSFQLMNISDEYLF